MEGVAGANWDVDLLAAKVLNKNGSGSYANIANGILWAADNGANVINLSLGGTFDSTTLRNAVNTAWNKGAVLACAAGNSGSSQKSYPGAYTNCIAVGATNENDQKASFSNYSKKWVDIGAPGVNILSTMPNSPVTLTTTNGYYENYDSLNGTSMATPHVAGVAGLVWSTGLCAAKDNTCVRNRIQDRADQVSGLANYWPNGRRLNALESVSP
jgi:thermitase